MRRSQTLTALALLAAMTLMALGVTSSTTLATPAPKQLAWRFAGQNNFEQQGTTIHDAGDVSGDGVRDIIVGLHTVETSASGNHISARVYSGSDGSFLMKIAAPVQSHGSSNQVASLGDLDGDGRSEFIVGTPGAQVSVIERAGVVRIFRSSGVLLGTKSGSGWGAQFGTSVASAGDVNADGLPDIIVGAPGDARVFVYSGDQTTGFPLLATLQGGLEPDDRFGASVGTAGDIDGDARSEVIVGAPHFLAAGGHGGRIYVFNVVEPGDPVYSITGSGPTDLLGTDVDGGRDLNGDSVPDFMGSAMGTDITGPPGFGYVKTYSGANSSVLQTFTSSEAGDLFGFSAELSDSCSDGKTFTLIVGAPQTTNPDSQKITGRVVAFNAASGAQLTEIYGENLLDGMGIGVGGFVDLTGDGKAEFLAGAHGMSDPPALWTNGSGFVYSCVNIPRPDILAVPNPANFGDVSMGTTQDMTVQIQNQGDADLVVTGLALTAASNAAFSFSGLSTPATIPPSGSQSVTVHYGPTTMGIHGGTLQVQSNDPDSPTYDIVLVGKGRQRNIEVTPASANFGAVDVGDMSWASIQVKNVGNEILAVNSIALTSGSASDFSLGALPSLPKSLAPGQKFTFPAIYTPTVQGAHSGTIEIGSNDPLDPTTLVPLSGSGVPPNLPPTAVIKMDVPYTNGANTIQFRGGDSVDPDGWVDSYLWDFGHDDQVSSQMDPAHTFPCVSAQPCLFVVRLTVTDNGGKSDPTSVTVIAWSRPLRSRFYGTIKQGGHDVRDETVVEAWINDKKVAESLTQTHLGQSVFAIEVPPDVHATGDGGTDGDTVVFKYNQATADQTGTWYRATDQELDLTAPYYHIPFGVVDWCLRVVMLGTEICGPPSIVPPGGLNLELQEWPVPPIPDPGPLKTVGTAFEITMIDAASGRQLTTFRDSYEIRRSYTDNQLTAAGIADESSLGLYYIAGSEWSLAGTDTLDAPSNQIVTSLNHTSIFGLMGTSLGAPLTPTPSRTPTPTATSTATRTPTPTVTATPTATAPVQRLYLPVIQMRR